MIYFPSHGSFPIVWPLFRPFSLSSSHISTNIHTHCFFNRFFSPSVNSSPTSYIHFPSPGKFFQLFGAFFQSIYSACFFSLFIQSIFLPTFSILWVSYLTYLHQLLCLLPTLLVFQPFIYPINFHTPNHKALTQDRR